MKKEKSIFIKDKCSNDFLLKLLFLITSPISVFLFYDVFKERKYFLNRKKLISILKNKNTKLLKSRRLTISDGIKELYFDYEGEIFEIWLYEKENKITLNTDDIGLFVGGICGMIQNRKIIKLIRYHDMPISEKREMIMAKILKKPFWKIS